MDCPYWTEEDDARAEKVQFFPELGKVVVDALARVPRDHLPLAQVCGPITTGGFGSEEVNRRVLEVSIRMIRKEGRRVFDQTVLKKHTTRIRKWWQQLENNSNQYCTLLLEGVYGQVYETGLVDTLIYIPGSQGSTGYLWERARGISLGFAFEPYPPHLFRRVIEEVFSAAR